MADSAGELGERLIQSAVLGELGPLREALAAGADIQGRDSFGMSALMHACCWGNSIAALELVEAGADPLEMSPEGLTAADMAAENGYCSLAELMLALLERKLLGGIEAEGKKGRAGRGI